MLSVHYQKQSSIRTKLLFAFHAGYSQKKIIGLVLSSSTLKNLCKKSDCSSFVVCPVTKFLWKFCLGSHEFANESKNIITVIFSLTNALTMTINCQQILVVLIRKKQIFSFSSKQRIPSYFSRHKSHRR